MSLLISSYLPFPNIAWWSLAANADSLYLDPMEPFRKMTYRNRYYISGSQGWMALSIPLAGGRDQKSPMKDLRIDGTQPWGKQHLRTLGSVYGRSPYFSHYAPTLAKLYSASPIWLIEFNAASIEWLAQCLGLSFSLVSALPSLDTGDPGVPNQDLNQDLRNWRPGIEKTGDDQAAYYQLFTDRNPFFPNLSLLDLLFQEGPHTLHWIRNHQALLASWAAASAAPA